MVTTEAEVGGSRVAGSICHSKTAWKPAPDLNWLLWSVVCACGQEVQSKKRPRAACAQNLSDAFDEVASNAEGEPESPMAKRKQAKFHAECTEHEKEMVKMLMVVLLARAIANKDYAHLRTVMVLLSFL